MVEPINIDATKIRKNFVRFWKFFLVIFLVVVFGPKLLVTIDAGETGVYSLFGKVKDNELSSGLHVVNPLGVVTRMNIRTDEYTMSVIQGEGKRDGVDSISALTKEGLKIDLDITVLYHLKESEAARVYQTVGLAYEEKVIRPEIRSAIREIIAQYEAKDVYSEKREEANIKLKNALSAKLDIRGIELEDVLLRNVQLPANLAVTIQEKLQAEQESQKYEFILEKETKEKQRKIIEAEGQRDAQTIITGSLSPNYLYYLYIKDLKDREGTIYVPTDPSTGMPTFKELGK